MKKRKMNKIKMSAIITYYESRLYKCHLQTCFEKGKKNFEQKVNGLN